MLFREKNDIKLQGNFKRHLHHFSILFYIKRIFSIRFLEFDEITFPNKNNWPAEVTSGGWKLDELELKSRDVHFDHQSIIKQKPSYCKLQFCNYTRVYAYYTGNDQSGLRNYDLLRTVS